MVFACACVEIEGSGGVGGRQGGYGGLGQGIGVGDRSGVNGSALAQPVMTARQLFQMILPLLSCERASVRQASVVALGSIHWLSYQTFLEDIQPYMRSVTDDMRAKLAARSENAGGRRTGSSNTSSSHLANKRFDRLRMELTHVLGLVADFVDHQQYRHNEALMSSVTSYVRETARFLSEPDVQYEWDHQMLRYYFCGFLERFFDHLVRACSQRSRSELPTTTNSVPETADTYLPFDLRLALFRLLEQWCGYGQYATKTRDREAKMMYSVLEQVKDVRERGVLTATMEEQRKALEYAALKAMAALCKGPIVNASNPNSAFDLKSLVAWIDSVFASPDARFHGIARVALEALLTHNGANTQLLDDIVQQCYVGDVGSTVTLGYFMALVDVFVKEGGDEQVYASGAARIVALALYKAGDPNLHVRRGAVRLLRAAEKKFWGGSGGDDKSFRVDWADGQSVFGPVPKMLDDEPDFRERAAANAGANAGEGEEGTDDDTNGMAAMSFEDEEHATYEAAAITSSLPIIYKYAQAMVSARLANERPEITYEILSEMVMMIELVATPNEKRQAGYPQGVKDILIFMVPWVRNIELSFIAEDDGGIHGPPKAETASHSSSSIAPRSNPKGSSEIILTNLFCLTIKYGDEYVTEIENLWVQLVDRAVDEKDMAEGDDTGTEDEDDVRVQMRRRGQEELLAVLDKNVNMVVEFLLIVGVQKRNPKFVAYAKKVMVYLARTVACPQLVDALIARISPRNLVPESSTEAMTKTNNVDAAGKDSVSPSLYMSDLEQVLVDMPTRPAFSKGQLACVLLVDLAIEVGTALHEHLPLLLHIIFVQLDHFITLICEQNRLLLINLIQSLVPRDVAGDRIDAVHAALSLKEGKRLWPYEDVTYKNRGIESPKQLGALVLEVLDLFSIVDPDLAQNWGETALTWGTACPVRHVACRSLQIFRTLMPAFSQRMLGDLLHRLASTVADPTEEIQGFALEIIATLDEMVESLDSHRLVLFPQLFWAAVACIHSPHELEYLEGVQLLEKILAKLDLNDASRRNILLINLPTRWKGHFGGMQPLLLRGLVSSNAERACLKVLNMLVPLENDALVDPSPARILFGVLANFPRLLQGFEPDPQAEGGKEAGVTIESCLEVAGELSAAAERKGCPGLARLLASYSKRRFRTKDDFLKQFVFLIRDKWFPAYEAATLQFLMGLLGNTIPFCRRRTLMALKVLLPVLAAERSMGGAAATPAPVLDEDMLAPLVALLQTDFADEALAVLDEAMAGVITAGETNYHFLIFGGKSIHKIARETGDSLGGEEGRDGEDTGWRVRDQAGMAKVTRYNMGGVASTCGGGHDFLSGGRKGASNGGFGMSRDDSGSKSWEGINIPNGNGNLNVRYDLDRGKWAVDDLNSNLLEALDDLDAFFGRDDVALLCQGEEVIKINGHASILPPPRNSESRTGTAVAASGSSGEFYDNPLLNALRNERGRKGSLASVASDVSYSAESLGAPLTRDVSLSSLFVNGILDESQEDGVDAGRDDKAGRDGGEEFHANSVPALHGQSKLNSSPHRLLPVGGANPSISPARRLLSHPGAAAHITFRLRTSYSEVSRDTEFNHWLRTDLSGVLHVDPSRLVVEKVEPEGGPSNPNSGTLVTLQVHGENEANGVEGAAYAEELRVLISGEGESDRLPEHHLLRQGVVMWNVDSMAQPEIIIGFMGINVPYLPEGLRFELPHRRRQQTGHDQSNARPMPASPQRVPTAEIIRPPPEPGQPQTPLTPNTALEVFRIYPAAFELAVQLHEDWLAFVGDLLRSGRISGEEVQLVYRGVEGMQAGYADGSGNSAGRYCPPLVRDEDGRDLEAVAQRLLAYQEVTSAEIANLSRQKLDIQYLYLQVDPPYLHSFLEERQQRVSSLNGRLTDYLASRQTVGDLAGVDDPTARKDSSLAGAVVELAWELETLYLEVLNLEAPLERFLNVKEEPRIEEEEAAQRCIDTCRNAIQSLPTL
ncbi:Cell morphogenesis protein PAG1 [Borealophlyctis nickersoniae]|nr:Cell morphogenesis protein PAG1 [Borealophlyctis nickersoniae]